MPLICIHAVHLCVGVYQIVCIRDVNTGGDNFDSLPACVIIGIFARVTVGLKDSFQEMMHLIYIF